MNEEWRPVVGYQGLYEVSNLGRVRSVDRTSHYKDGRTYLYRGRVLKLRKGRDGHLRINLCKDGKLKTKFVHRMVLEAFVGPCPEGMECLHIDGNPANNCVDNLSWGTRGENMLDRVRHGSHHNANKTRCPQGHELKSENLVKSLEAKGRRGCLACGRARSYLWNHPELRDQFQQVADRYYQAIIKERNKTWQRSRKQQRKRS